MQHLPEQKYEALFHTSHDLYSPGESMEEGEGDEENMREKRGGKLGEEGIEG